MLCKFNKYACCALFLIIEIHFIHFINLNSKKKHYDYKQLIIFSDCYAFKQGFDTSKLSLIFCSKFSESNLRDFQTELALLPPLFKPHFGRLDAVTAFTRLVK